MPTDITLVNYTQKGEGEIKDGSGDTVLKATILFYIGERPIK